MAPLSEKRLLDRLMRIAGDTRGRELVVGTGDDAAVIRGPREDYVISKDAQVEGTHFFRTWLSPGDIGRRLAAVNLSDIAAMGARARYALLSFVVPRKMPEREVVAIQRGAVDLLRRYGADVVGGNVSAGGDALVCDMTIIGTCPRGKAWRREAHAGDAVVVVGALGDAAAGLALLRSSRGKRSPKLTRAFCVPRPLLDVVVALRGSVGVHAAIDVSDGFSTDLLHMCDAGGVGVDVDASRIPVSRALASFCRDRGEDPVAFAMRGGEDYALILSVAPRAAKRICERIARRANIPAIVVGKFTKAKKRRVTWPDGTHTRMTASGWDHFRR